ncbi:molybdopterin molybdenumtransferase MoeA [Rathayibacter sp. VKM Ac-2803]|uniref:molybdopterin molybdotransferase MoeA n=1 Tax=Rathayibacter sp. VKM Ac-2803 TaxID=2609256 RepID=UPI00135B5FF3|nr:molybdopterin molybdotransferase MoeA [Rathayibacter sp. VKM Ac-2803]MWV49210.1 molybdopterin molybdenumtransferase MoeA [Rathayibacter sp. VKM Ac-2803]
MSGHQAVDWGRARALVAAGAVPLASLDCALSEAEGCVSAGAVRAPRPLPHYDSSAMDGWMVRGAGPWRLGTSAQPVVTGALVPEWCEAIVPSEEGIVRGDVLTTARPPAAGRHIRRAGDEAAERTVLVEAGVRLRPSHLALLAVAGLDSVRVRPRPPVALVFTGDEIDTRGMPEPGRVRDAFTPLLPSLVRGLGGAVDSVTRVGDDEAAITALLTDSAAPFVVTTGGTGRSRADAVRRAIVAAGGRTIIDGVAMRPGHPALVAALPGDRLVIALPGNPLAAVLAGLSLLAPAIDAASGVVDGVLEEGLLGEELGRAGTTTLVPVRLVEGRWRAAAGIRSHMLTGLSASEAVAVVPPTGGRPGDSVPLLRLPW